VLQLWKREKVIPKMDRYKRNGTVAPQISDLAIKNSDMLNQIQYGQVVFHIQKGNVWRMEVIISVKTDNRNTEGEERND